MIGVIIIKPKVYANKINKQINNNSSVYHFTRTSNQKELNNVNIDNNVNVKLKINELFSSSSFVYKFDAYITLKDGSEQLYSIVALKDDSLITIDGDKLNISDIANIKKTN